MSVPSPAELEERVARAAARRASVAEVATAYRLVHGDADGLDGLAIDRLGAFALVKYRDVDWAEDDSVNAIVGALSAVGVEGATFRFDAPEKVRTSSTNARDEAIDARMDRLGFQTPRDEFTVREYGHSFLVSTRSGFSCGLFFDMREVRHELSRRWEGRRVLNLFAYTCGFGVALAGANDVVNVDTSATTLEWGRRNYAVNGLETPSSAFVRKDAFQYLRVAGKVGNRFDAIVLDPPSYSAGKRGRSRRFSITRDLGTLVELALDALTPAGELLVAANAASLDHDEFQALVAPAAETAGRDVVHSWPPAPDFPVQPQHYHLKTALIGSSA